MSNMSYCRFRNTLSDLLDCQLHLEDEDLSKDEQVARKNLLDVCAEMLESSGYHVEEPSDEEGSNDD